MQIEFSTLNSVLDAIAGAPDEPLVFRTGADEIGAGYHVTEFKKVAVESVDCGQKLNAWNEVHMQLLDSSGKQHMKAGDFSNIARKSANLLDGLASADFYVEYAPGNRGLRRMKVSAITRSAGRTLVDLADDQAQCKALLPNAQSASSCC